MNDKALHLIDAIDDAAAAAHDAALTLLDRAETLERLAGDLKEHAKRSVSLSDALRNRRPALPAKETAAKPVSFKAQEGDDENFELPKLLKNGRNAA